MFIVGAYHVNRGASLELSQYGRYYFITMLLLMCGSFLIYYFKDMKSVPKLRMWQYVVVVMPVAVGLGADDEHLQ